MNEYNLTDEQIEEISTRLADLKIQAMIFDMDIDIETWSLVPKDKFKHPFWIRRWREQQENSDYTPDGSDDQEYDNER